MPELRQTWDNSHFFNSSQDPRITRQIEDLKVAIAQLTQACSPFVSHLAEAEHLPAADYPTLIAQISAIHRQRVTTIEQLSNISTFLYSCFSVNAQDSHASASLPTIQQLGSQFDQALKPLQVFLVRASDDFITALLADPSLAELSHGLHHERKLKDQLLSIPEEQLISGLGVHGLQGWGNLYRELASSLQCDVVLDVDGQLIEQSIGLAQAANQLSSTDRPSREATWRAIQVAWTSRQETVSTILNAINGWRLEESQKRGQTRQLHYLDKSCHQNSIDRATLDALIDATHRHRHLGQRALKAMAQAMNLPQMAPWDLFAPAPKPPGDSPQSITFDEAIALIADAFGQLNPAMGAFVVMMAENGWIDAKPSPHRSTGAYCTQFANPREPRVFMTFDGSMGNVTTLAHELGHAWHNWELQDLPLAQTRYPMTLAETASVFGETLVRKALLARATDPHQKLAILWQDAESATAFLVNIPARFEFEKRLVEARKEGFVTADRLKALMTESWQLWYDDSLSEYDPMFWASKLHFSIAQLGFYNYPYLFGYLFSLGIYAQQQAQVRDNPSQPFHLQYREILRDTGSMVAEELVDRHLHQDIRQPQFWEASLAMVEEAIAEFEQLVDSIYGAAA
jgi:oligoendopeptidase F